MTPPNVIFVPTPASPQSLGDLAWYNPNAANSTISSYNSNSNFLTTPSLGTNRVQMTSTDVSSVHPRSFLSGMSISIFLSSGQAIISMGIFGNATVQNDLLVNTVAVKITVGGVEYVSSSGTNSAFRSVGMWRTGFDFSNLSSANVGDSIDFEIYY